MDNVRLPNNFQSTKGQQMIAVPLLKDRTHPQDILSRFPTPNIRRRRIRRENRRFKTKWYFHKIIDRQRVLVEAGADRAGAMATAQAPGHMERMLAGKLWNFWTKIIANQKEMHIGDKTVMEVFDLMDGVKKKEFMGSQYLQDKVFSVMLQHQILLAEPNDRIL